MVGEYQSKFLFNFWVVELNNANFDEVVGKEKYVVVKFYTRWCKFCRIMSPEYEKLFDYFKEKRNDVVIARLEGSMNQEISMKYGINSFPMVVLFLPNDKRIRGLFQGQRVVSHMSQWIEENAPQVVEELQILEEDHNDEITEEKSDDNLVIKTANKTEVTEELEFVKRELISLKTKIDTLEGQLADLKNQTAKPIVPEITNHFSIFQVFKIFGFLTILAAAVLTLKKIFSKKTIFLGTDHTHAKV